MANCIYRRALRREKEKLERLQRWQADAFVELTLAILNASYIKEKYYVM